VGGAVAGLGAGIGSRLPFGKKDDKAAAAPPGGGKAAPVSAVGGSASPLGAAKAAPAKPDDKKAAKPAAGKAAAPANPLAALRERVTALPLFGGDTKKKPAAKAAKVGKNAKPVEYKPLSISIDKRLEILGIVMVISAIVILLSSLSPTKGALTEGITTFLSRTFGWGALGIPLAMLPIGVWLIMLRAGEETPTVDTTRVVGVVLFYLALITLFHFVHAIDLYQVGAGQDYLTVVRNVFLNISAELGRGGGVVGGEIYYLLLSNIGELGGFLVVIAVLMIALMLVTSLSVSQLGVIAISLARSFNDGRKRWAVRNAAKRAELTEKRRVALAAKAAASPVTASGPAGVAVPAGMTFAPPVAAGGAPAPVPAPSAAAPAPAFAPAMMTTTGGLPLPPTPAVSAMALPALGQPPIAEPERSILITGGGRTMTVSPTGAPVSTPPPTAAPAFAPNAPVPAAAPMVNAPAANAPTPAASTPFAPPPAGTPLAPVPSSIATPTPSTGTPFAPPSPIGGQPATLTPAATSALPPAAGSPPKDDKKPGLFGGLPFGRKDGADKAPTPALAGAGNGAPAAGSPPKTDDGKARGLPFGNPLKRGGKDDTESASAANGGQSSVPAAANAGGAAASPALAGAPSGYVSPFRAATPPTPPPVGAPTVVATPTNAPTSGVSAANTGSAPANDSKPFDPRAANVTAASGVSAANTGSAPANDSKPFDPRAANTTPASAPASGTSAANTGSEPANDSKPFDPRAANTTPASGVSAANTGSAPANDSKPFDPRAANTTPASAPTGGTSAANTGSAPANDSKPFDPRAANVTSNGASTSAPAVPTPTADTPAAQPMGVPLRPAPYQRTPLTGAVAARDDAATKTGEVVRMGAGTVPPPVSAPKKPAVFDDDEDDLDADFDLDDADALMRPAQPKGLGALPRATSTTARVMPTVPTTQTADVPKVAPSAHPPSPTVAPSGSAPAPSGVGAAARAAAGVGAALVGSALGALASGENNPSTPSQTVATPAAGNTPPARRVPPWEDEPAPMPAARTPDPVPAPMPAARTPDPIPVAAPVPAARTPDPVPTPAASANGDAEPAPNAPQVTRSKRKTYTLPDFAPLLQSGTDHELDHEKLIERARVIEETLSSFGAPGRVVEVRTGPVITQFGVEPDYLVARGGKKNRVKVSAIAALDKDLQLALGAKSIRIEAPVPGKGYVGIEVPNESPSVVRLRDVLESPEYNRIKSPLAFALGQSVDGTPVAAALDSMPHLLIAGTTGSGKSVCVNAIIGSLLIRNSPERLKLIMVDPKRVELTGYNGIPHLIAPVVVEHDRAVNVLKWVTREMDDRYRRFASAGARNLDDYNKHLPAGEEILPYIVVVIDELADLMMLSPDETERTITRIAALARATGIHLVIATQRPSVDVVTGLIKANFPARIAFAVASSTDSRVILDQPGADRLLGRGDMLYMSGDSPAPVRLQGVFVSDSEIGNVTRFWRGQVDDMDLAAARPAITAFALDEMSSKGDNKGGGKGRGGSGAVIAPWQRDQNKRPKSDDDDDFVTEDWDGDGDVDSDDDELYNQAVDMVRRLDKASVSLLQRRLRIGYTRAARLIDVMEERGVVGPAVEGSKPRDVLPPKV
jgi:S-DNA-T family DNA segregation ATPase FtsK/SpoIIIE